MKRRRAIQSKGNTILTCDPSLTAWGWAVVNTDDSVVASGCIKTAPSPKKQRIRAGDDFARRIKELDTILLSIMTTGSATLD